MSNKTTHITRAEKCPDLYPDAKKFMQCSIPAMVIVVILIAGNSLTLKAQSSRSAFTANVPAYLMQQSIINLNKKDTINKKAAPTPGGNTAGMVSPALDKQEHPVKKTDNSDATPFDEAMVMAYTSKKKTTNDANAHPQAGWENFKKYTEDKAVAPGGKTGTVQLSFIVNANSKLSDFKIINSFDNAANKAAIDLVKNGPVWVPASGGIAKEVTVKVDFH